MSRLSLGKKLQPAKKAWKTFTSKLQTKLHKLHKSKAITKPRKKHPKNSTSTNPKSLLQSTLSLYFPLQRKKRRRLFIKPSLTLHPYYYRRYLLRKRPASHVYYDEFFKQPADPEMITAATSSGEKRSAAALEEEMVGSSGLGSPSDGIDERAEEFIARFRAEMELQEMMARDPEMITAATSSGEKRSAAVLEEEMVGSSGLGSPSDGIDERAEEFIARFRAEMELQEMMARGL